MFGLKYNYNWYYTVYKELERVLKIEKYPLSVEKAAELTHNMYQIEITLPESLHCTKIILKMDENQKELIHRLLINFSRFHIAENMKNVFH